MEDTCLGVEWGKAVLVFRVHSRVGGYFDDGGFGRGQRTHCRQG